MTSERKRAANRRNAAKSTGPRTTAGKARTRRNALRHGLSLPLAAGIGPELEALAAQIAGQRVTYDEAGQARIAAHAQLEVERVRQAKASLITSGAKRMMSNGSNPEEGAAFAFANNAKTLAACDRYEKRALSRRNRALRALHALQGEKS